MHFRKMLSGIALSAALLGTGTGVALTSVHPAQVQAAYQFPVRWRAKLPKYKRGGCFVVTAKKAHVYSSRGRRTKKYYKKGTILHGYGWTRIYGRKFFIVKKNEYVLPSEVKQRWVGNVNHTVNSNNHYHWSWVGNHH